jgi:hypothetical protein
MLRAAFRHRHSDMPDPPPANPQKSAVSARATQPRQATPIAGQPGQIHRAPSPKVLRRSPSVTLWIGRFGDDATGQRISTPYYIRARTAEPVENRAPPGKWRISPVFLIGF